MSLSINDVIEQIKTTATGQAQGNQADPEKLKALAAQFESMLVSQMLQEMRSSMFENGDDAGSAPLADSLFAELSLAISRAGGLGFTESITSTLVRQTAGEQVAATQGLQNLVPAIAPMQDSAPSVVLPGRVSSAYGWRTDPINAGTKFHKGMDIALPHGHEVPAPREGRVVFAGEQQGYGNTVIVDHGGQMTTRYAHLSEIAVREGEDVTAGQLLGRVGATGRATGPHLHLEVLEAGQTVNPAEKLATYTGSRPQ